jgi:hypothetical protein
MADKKREQSEDGREPTSYGANEREQTEHLERIHRKQDQSDEFVTDAEMEVREANGEQ